MKQLNHITPWIPGILVSAAVLFALTSMVNDSQIVDEIPHVGAGYSYLVKQDMRLNPEHPPLAKDIAAIPLLFMNINQNIFATQHWLTGLNDQWEFGRLLIYNSGNDADQIKFWSRVPMLLFFIFSALFVFRWGRELYGETGALIALILFLFSPTILAHTRFVTTDVPSLFGVLISIYYFLRFLKKPTTRTILCAGVALGVALLLKFNTFLLLPLFAVLTILYVLLNMKGKRLAHLFQYLLRAALVVIVAFLVVWLVYLFHVWNYPPERQLADTKALLNSFGNKFLADPVVWMADKPVLRAFGQYLLGFLMVVQRSAGGNTIYFLGEIKNQGGLWYFPLVYFLKEPLAWWLLVLTAGIGGLYRVMQKRQNFGRLISWMRNHFPETAMMLWIALYWYISLRSTLNIGIRHMLPTYPFMILLVAGLISKIADWLREHEEKHIIRWFSLGVAGLLGWYVFETLSVHPHYLTYFNQVAGGPAGGHRFVTDSNLDWGQDLKRLSQFAEQRGIKQMSVDYFGWADPKTYLGQKYVWTTAQTYTSARDFITRNRTDGWIAISATFFQQASTPSSDNPNKEIHYDWLNSYEPVAVIGNSIFVWRITK